MSKTLFLQEDAADWLNKLLEICSAQVRHGHNLFGKNHGETEAANFGALIEPVFQKRQACAGTSTICPNKKVRPKAVSTGDLYCPMIPVGVEDDTVSLYDSILRFMKYDTELYCSNCKASDEYKNKLGRFWNTFVETPEILFIRVNRYRFLDGELQKHRGPLDIPETLDLGKYLEERSAYAGETCLYKLKRIVAHQGDLEYGHYVSFVKDHHYAADWVRISDDEIRLPSFENAVRTPDANGRYNSTFFPYILAYNKEHDSPVPMEEEPL